MRRRATASSRLAGSGLWSRLAGCVVLACGPLTVALLTEGRSAGEDSRVLFLLTLALALAIGAVLLLRVGDARRAREVAAPERALRQARDQQAATTEILGAIAASPADLPRVLDTIARNAARVCDGLYGQVYRLDGDEIRLAAHYGLSSARTAALGKHSPRNLDAEGLTANAIRDASVVHCPDVLTDSRFPSWGREIARAEGFRSMVVVPMLQGGRVLGTLNVSRPEGAFTERQIGLLRTFADQAVIALENVRLFQELQARNRELTEALEQQTATGEVLRVISGSPMDTQPVFEAIVASAVRLCDGRIGALYRIDDDTIDVLAFMNPDDEARRTHDSSYPRSLATLEAPFRDLASNGALVHLVDVDAAVGLSDTYRERARILGYRTGVAVPMVREGRVLGLISVGRAGPGRTPRPFSDREIGLLRTFADQAVIAIENVRLFQELRARNRELTEALEQQTATGEILRVISSSPTDVQPTFDAIAASATRLCEALQGSVFRFDGSLIHLTAHHGQDPVHREALRRTFPIPPGRGSMTARAILTRSVVHGDAAEDPEHEHQALTRIGASRVLAVPMLQDGAPIGAITVSRDKGRPFSDNQIALLQTFGAQAVIAIENVRLFRELEARNRDLSEALEQQTATGEILRVISGSPADLQPVMDAVAESAARFCGADNVVVYRSEGGVLRVMAVRGPLPAVELPITRGVPSGRAVLDRETVHVPDLLTVLDEYPEAAPRMERTGVRAMLAAPLLRTGEAIGTITIRRDTYGPFTDKQVKLLETFAHQAVIAIENVRLFQELEARNRELSESLEQQTATAEILGVISRSPTDLQPVLEAATRNASRLCGAANISLYRVEGSLMRKVAEEGITALTTLRVGETRPIARTSVGGRAIVDRTTIHVPDHQSTEAAREYPDARRDTGIRTSIGIPLLREGVGIGAFTAYRTEARPFAEREVALLQTFADQAVIAIENVRLFTELGARNRELTETLEQQTATSEILRVISGSPTNIQPVFDTIVESVARLCDGVFTTLFRFEDEMIHPVAYHRSIGSEGEEIHQRMYPRPPSGDSVVARAILDRAIVHVADVEGDPDVPPATRELARAVGYQSILAVPMLREGSPIGALGIGRREASGKPRPFSDREIELIRTFADQAVIAIENVRLFTELGARNRELTESLEQQTATSEILRAISASPTDTQPVFDTIAQHAFRVCDGSHCTVMQFDGTLIHMVAHHGQSPGALEVYRQTYPLPPDADTMVARSIREGAVVHNPDMLSDPSEAVRRISSAGGYRTGVIVPMLRSGRAIGAIGVGRSGPGGAARPYTEKEIALLQTFADQGVIAVENVRLFRELETRTRELARSVEELQALSEVGRAVSSTLDLPTVLATIVARAVQLSGTSSGVLYEYDEATQTFHLQASHQTEAEVVEALRASPLQLGEGATGRAVVRRGPVEVVDLLEDQQFKPRLRTILTRLGYRSILSIPLLLEQRILGALTVSRREPGSFPPETVSLLQTFATQSALAIQNARLFREIEAKGRELEVASRHKSQFLANMSHELRTPLNAVLGYTELLIDGIYGELSPKAGDVMTRIDRSGKHLLGLINDVLDLSKIEAGQLELALADYALGEVVHAVLTQVESLAAEKGLILQAAVAPDLPAGRGDERRLAQVLLNLVGNAIKFTEVGSVRIAAHRDGDAFVVSVADSGPGIAEADRQRIFEEFQQADSSSTRKKGGTGLGLSIARRIVELHGGRIWVESTVGRGSVFSFRVPVRVHRQVARA